jgi:hypothetical protein
VVDTDVVDTTFVPRMYELPIENLKELDGDFSLKIGAAGISGTGRCLLPDYFRSSRAVIRLRGCMGLLDVDDGAVLLRKVSVPSRCADWHPIPTSMKSQSEVR